MTNIIVLFYKHQKYFSCKMFTLCVLWMRNGKEKILIIINDRLYLILLINLKKKYIKIFIISMLNFT